MSESTNTGLESTLTFEPDEDAEEELDGEKGVEKIDKALITDETIRKCRILVATRCIEYGTVLVAPKEEVPAMLFVAYFTFHPYKSRVKEAKVELAFNKGSVAILQPESIDDNETEIIITKKLAGELKVGYDAVTAGISGERQSEEKKKSALRIRGSGANTARAEWTLSENPDDQKGIHLNFTTILIAKTQGEVEVDVEVRAKLGATLDNPFGIRKIITRKTEYFDGKSLLGFRPEKLEINEKYFKPALAS